ncbi:hypothetical protein HHL16_12770 [Pseudoflavitalea sp. G-6-1-2]|uniref:reprolysin-like metallopeptidase n=1 Tax=Pseudoflavitalea sp. G-6-1-2 TaxID=2728841 RepID=UPI00146B2F5C|nr:hypothetical protein [Pseudoflavitalea sp. G-6-1-2]NML21756.1 hypothetical protein [Pseudoflavitalea sp. G-6-1-2]
MQYLILVALLTVNSYAYKSTFAPASHPGNFTAVFRIDSSGNHYIDLTANYLVSVDDRASIAAADTGINFWNNQSGKFRLVPAKDSAGIKEYIICFALKVLPVKDPSAERLKLNGKRWMEGRRPGDNNLLAVVHDDVLGNGVAGNTDGYYDITIKESRKLDVVVIAHEIGHSLGAKHEDGGVMVESAENSSRKVTLSCMRTIMKFARDTMKLKYIPEGVVELIRKPLTAD